MLAKRTTKDIKNQPKNENYVLRNDAFLRVNFQRLLKMAINTIFLCKKHEENTLKMKSVDARITKKKSGYNFNIFYQWS